MKIALVPLCCIHFARFNILSLFFSETHYKPAKRKYRAIFYYLIEKHMQNSGTFEGRKINPKKSLSLRSVLCHKKVVVIKGQSYGGVPL